MSASIIRCKRSRTPRPGTLPRGKNDPGFRTKVAISAGPAARARAAGFAFRAVAADSVYGDQDGFLGELAEAWQPFVMALKPRVKERASRCIKTGPWQILYPPAGTAAPSDSSGI